MTPDIGETQLHLSLLRRESRAAVLPSPLVLLDKEQGWLTVAIAIGCNSWFHPYVDPMNAPGGSCLGALVVDTQFPNLSCRAAPEGKARPQLVTRV